MLKRFIFAVFVSVFCAFGGPANADQIVNVEYVHSVLEKKWGITIPMHPTVAQNPRVAANMKYLLTIIDRANAKLGTTSNYGTGSYATLAAADTVATNRAIENLIREPQWRFRWQLQAAYNYTQSFTMSAAGRFTVYWGDGTYETLNRENDTNPTQYSHTYPEQLANYTVTIVGRATGYSSDNQTPAITFLGNPLLLSVEGGLGRIFPTLEDGSQPSFYRTFFVCSNLFIDRDVPADLFDGIHGTPAPYMFSAMFQGDRKLTSVPGTLFSGLNGTAPYLFNQTFAQTGLTSVPANLFDGVRGAPAEQMFSYTFNNCTSLTSVPATLFSKVTGEPAPYMFAGTFKTSGLTSVPSGLFGGLDGAPADSMFSFTFADCQNLTTIPSGLFNGVHGAPANRMFEYTFQNTGLTSLPSGIFDRISGVPADYMFDHTFDGCAKLTTLPNLLFKNIAGQPANYMYGGTFSNSGLTSLPDVLFGHYSGAAVSNVFYRTFANNPSLTGPSARMLDGNGGSKYLYEEWPHVSDVIGPECYLGDTGLTDYDTMPAGWK